MAAFLVGLGHGDGARSPLAMLGGIDRGIWTMFISNWRVIAPLFVLAVPMFLARPARAQIASQRLVEAVDLSAPTVSPDGRYVAFRAEWASIERDRNESAWYVQRIEGGSQPRKVGDGGFPLRNSGGTPEQPLIVWSPDNASVYYLASIDGRLDVWRARVDGSGAEPVSQDPADVRSFSLRDDGQTLRYSVGVTRAQVEQAERDDYERGIRLDVSTPVSGALIHSNRTRGWAASPRYADVGFDRRHYLWDAPERWKEINVQSGEKRDISPPAKPISAQTVVVPKGTPTPVGVGQEPHAGRVALLLPTQGETDEGRVDLAMMPRERSSRLVRCSDESCSDRVISAMQWRPGSDEILFTTTDRRDGRRQSLLRWDVRKNRVVPVVRSEGLLNGGRGLPADGRGGTQAPCGATREILVCVAAEANHPPRLEWIELESGQRHVLYAPNAELDTDLQQAISARYLGWAGEDGKAFTGYLLEANGAAPARRPLFINYYNCDGFLRGGGMGDEWPMAAMVTAGISALCINDLPYDEDPIVRYSAGTAAVRSVVRILEAEGRVDPKRVGMGGLSFGSEVALWTAINSDLIATASLSTPFPSPMYYTLASMRGDIVLSAVRRNWGLGPVDETPEQWRKLSPFYNLEKIKIPLLFQMAEEEYGYGLDYVIPLIRRQQADAYVFPEEPHQKFLPRHKAAVYERNLDWFRFWLLGAEDSAPPKATQYRHWRTMKAAIEKVSQRAEINVAE